ncbi:MAG TPA: gamma carbonic anhydrase family protein [Dongiaceae bacterium]|nr:gamma carbonic anhydrase family protein [Dongiaceae bacterium]
MTPSSARSGRVVIDPTAFVAPGAALVGDVTLGAGASVWYNATLRGDLEAIVVGAESNIQDNCVVHVDVDQPARIGARVTLGHGAIVHAATIEDDVLVAMKAVVLSGCHVGTGSLIGAGAVVPEGTRIPPGSLVLGVPGRVVRPLRPDESERVRRNARSYVDLAAAYRAGAFGGGVTG